MKPIKLTESEIYTIIDSEISNDRLDGACKEVAERESGGNYDLMISRYFLKRVEELKGKRVFSDDRSKALDQRKIEAAKKILLRDSARQIEATVSKNDDLNGVFHSVLGNLILVGSSASAVITYLVLNGENVSYSVIAMVATICVVLPVLLSQMPIIKDLISYRMSLSVLGIIMCLVFVIQGVQLIGSDSRMAGDEGMSTESVDGENGREGEISLNSVSGETAVVDAGAY